MRKTFRYQTSLACQMLSVTNLDGNHTFIVIEELYPKNLQNIQFTVFSSMNLSVLERKKVDAIFLFNLNVQSIVNTMFRRKVHFRWFLLFTTGTRHQRHSEKNTITKSALGGELDTKMHLAL